MPEQVPVGAVYEHEVKVGFHHALRYLDVFADEMVDIVLVHRLDVSCAVGVGI
jgi:hypothetical protein